MKTYFKIREWRNDHWFYYPDNYGTTFQYAEWKVDCGMIIFNKIFDVVEFMKE